MKNQIYVAYDYITELTKVGTADEAEARIKSLQYALKRTDESVKIELIESFPNTRGLETKVKEYFADVRVSHPIPHDGMNEYFDCEAVNLIEFIKKESRPIHINTFDENGLSFNGMIVETIENIKGEEVLFDLSQLGDLLGYDQPRKAIDEEDKYFVTKNDFSNGNILPLKDFPNRGKNFTNERGFWTLCMKSPKDIAKPLQKWVCGEVLPSIRKYGMYVSPQKVYSLKEDILQLNEDGRHLRGKIRELLVLCRYDIDEFTDNLEDIIRLQTSNYLGRKERLIKLIREAIEPLQLEYRQISEDFDTAEYNKYSKALAMIERKYGNFKAMSKGKRNR